jgi:probable rRNA maturation factor
MGLIFTGAQTTLADPVSNAAESAAGTDPAEGARPGLDTGRADEEPHEPEPGGDAITLHLACDDLDPPLAGWLVPRFEQVLGLVGVPVEALTLAVVDDAHMAALHEQHTGEAGPTDVLTFDMRETGDAPLEGDLVLGRDVATRQAAQRGHAAREELLLYAVHGLMHLLGHDDHEPTAAAAMHMRENALLQAIGLPAVYGPVGEDEGHAPAAGRPQSGKGSHSDGV